MRCGRLQAGLICALLGSTELPAQHAGAGASPAVAHAGAAARVSPGNGAPSPSRGVSPQPHPATPHHAQQPGYAGHWPSWGYNSHVEKPRNRSPYVYPGYLSFGYGLPAGYGYAGGYDTSDDGGSPQPGPVAPYPPTPGDAEEAVNGPPPYRPLYQAPGEGPAAGPSNVPAPVRPQPATILIFKDGRTRQQVHNYALIGLALWALDGEARQEIPLQALDIPATVKANRDNGVDFALPTTR